MHGVEHRLLPRAVRLIAAGRVRPDPDEPACRAGRRWRLSRRGTEVSAPGDVRIRRALLSVSDKRGLVDFARGLAELGVEIVSTGGTARELAGEGHRDAPGRGLHRLPRDPRRPRQDAQPAHLRRACWRCAPSADHVDTLNEHEIEPIDLVCVNLYPFERVSPRRGVEDARGDREHRHRRPHADPGGGQEPRLHGGGGLARELRRGARGAARERRPAVEPHPREPRARGVRATPRATTPRSRAGSPSARRTSPPSTRARTRRCSTSPTARTRTSARPSTPRWARART